MTERLYPHDVDPDAKGPRIVKLTREELLAVITGAAECAALHGGKAEYFAANINGELVTNIDSPLWDELDEARDMRKP